MGSTRTSIFRRRRTTNQPPWGTSHKEHQSLSFQKSLFSAARKPSGISATCREHRSVPNLNGLRFGWASGSHATGCQSILDVLNLDLQLQNIKCSTVKTLPPEVYSKNTGWICTHLWYYSYIIHQRSDHLNVAKVWIKNNNPWLSRDHSETRPCHGCQDETVPMQSIKVCLAPNAPDHFHRLIMTDLIFCYIFIDFSKKQQSLPLISCKITKELLWRFASQIDHTGEELCVRDLSSPSLSSIQADSCRSKLF